MWIIPETSRNAVPIEAGEIGGGSISRKMANSLNKCEKAPIRMVFSEVSRISMLHKKALR
jgi:hypothetical protein